MVCELELLEKNSSKLYEIVNAKEKGKRQKLS